MLDHQPLLQVCRLGRVPYRETWTFQKSLADLRKKDLIADTLLLLEHEHVITYGRNVGPSSLLFDQANLQERGVELVESDRGGDATYHGPGQLVAYPIIDLKVDLPDVRKYVWNLEECMLAIMRDYHIEGGRVEGAPGAWVKGKTGGELDCKMGAVGVRLSRWVTHHGVGFNVTTDLQYFKLIVPCGLSDKGVTSLIEQVQRQESFDPQAKKSITVVMKTIQDLFIGHFSRLFKRRVVELNVDELKQQIRNVSPALEESP